MTIQLVKTIRCRVAKISMSNDGILYMEFYDDEMVQIEDRIEVVEAIKSLYTGSKLSAIIKAGDRIKISNEARKFDMNAAIEGLIDKEALIIQSLSTRISAHFFYKLRKPSFEIKVFSKMEDAEKWVSQSKNADQNSEIA